MGLFAVGKTKFVVFGVLLAFLTCGIMGSTAVRKAKFVVWGV